ncbi:MAG: diacylglycerol kinase family protein [Pyrinomonadaceae bacterium]
MVNDASTQVIINSQAGGAEGNSDQLEARLRKYATWRVDVARSGEDLSCVISRAVNGDAKIVIAAGGDGTVNAVASSLVGTDKIFGILPTGTLNHFAKDLGLPLELDAALKTIEQGYTARVDVGAVNGEIFLNNSSLGLYPSIVKERQKQQRLGSGKWAAFIWATVTVLRRYPFLDVRLAFDGTTYDRRTPFVFIGNNRYEMERFNIGGRACLDRGELSLYMTDHTGRLGLIRLALRALFGGLLKEKDFTAMCTQEIWIGTRHSHLRVALDGEIKEMRPPLVYRVRPGALCVLVPNGRQS